MADGVREPILSLDTLVEHRVVVVDGERYELVNASELSILDYHRIGKQGARVYEMMEQDEDLSDEQVRTLSELLDAMCKILLRAPDDVHARLRDNQRLAVINIFTELSRQEMKAPIAGDEEAPQSTGESTSRD